MESKRIHLILLFLTFAATVLALFLMGTHTDGWRLLALGVVFLVGILLVRRTGLASSFRKNLPLFLVLWLFLYVFLCMGDATPSFDAFALIQVRFGDALNLGQNWLVLCIFAAAVFLGETFEESKPSAIFTIAAYVAGAIFLVRFFSVLLGGSCNFFYLLAIPFCLEELRSRLFGGRKTYFSRYFLLCLVTVLIRFLFPKGKAGKLFGAVLVDGEYRLWIGLLLMICGLLLLFEKVREEDVLPEANVPNSSVVAVGILILAIQIFLFSMKAGCAWDVFLYAIASCCMLLFLHIVRVLYQKREQKALERPMGVALLASSAALTLLLANAVGRILSFEVRYAYLFAGFLLIYIGCRMASKPRKGPEPVMAVFFSVMAFALFFVLGRNVFTAAVWRTSLPKLAVAVAGALLCSGVLLVLGRFSGEKREGAFAGTASYAKLARLQGILLGALYAVLLVRMFLVKL